jgi:hypothetical protein
MGKILKKLAIGYIDATVIEDVAADYKIIRLGPSKKGPAAPLRG